MSKSAWNRYAFVFRYLLHALWSYFMCSLILYRILRYRNHFCSGVSVSVAASGWPKRWPKKCFCLFLGRLGQLIFSYYTFFPSVFQLKMILLWKMMVFLLGIPTSMQSLGQYVVFYALSSCILVVLLKVNCIFSDVPSASYFTMRLSSRQGFNGAHDRLLWRQLLLVRLALGRLRPLHGF